MGLRHKTRRPSGSPYKKGAFEERSSMAIKTIPLSHLERDLERTLDECADSGQAVVVELPDQRLLAIQSLDPNEDDSLMDELLARERLQGSASKSAPPPRAHGTGTAPQ
jgi:hypothetical protein